MRYFIFLLILLPLCGIAQINVYNDSGSLVTGTWNGQGTLTQVSTNSPYEGVNHYQFTYNYSEWWAGFGLNLDAWGTSAARNLSGYQYLRIAYRGISGGEFFRIALKSGANSSPDISIGYSNTAYQVVYIPMSSFTGVNLSAITEITGSLTGTISSSGTLYFDDIRVTNQGPQSYNGANANFTSPEAWNRFAKMGKGVNLSNWLEAHWLLPNNFPEANRFNRSKVQNLVNLGFKNFRLPVTFERLAGPSPNYTIPANSPIWAQMDSVVLWAQQMDFTLIICNHHGFEITNNNYNSEISIKRAIWNQVMSRYGSLSPERYFFEIFNEPTITINNSNLHTVFDSLIVTIRSFNTNHTLIIGGNGWNSSDGLVSSLKYSDPNVIYTYHDYNPYAFTHQGLPWTTPAYLPVRAFPEAGSTDSIDLVNGVLRAQFWADTSGVPVMLGELGASTAADEASRCNWINTIGSATRSVGMPYYYWDATTSTNAFGFINSSNIPTPCFASSLKLGSPYNTCAKMVTQNGNSGDGSLRDQIGCATNGDTILISSSLVGDTIFLSNGPLVFNKNVTLLNATGGQIYLSHLWPSTTLNVNTGVQANISNINLLSSYDNLVSNKGIIHLNNILIHMAPGNTFINKGNIQVVNNVNVRN